MPVIRGELSSENRPPWSQVTSAGLWKLHANGATFDRHYHECNEYWLIVAGKARIMTEQKEYYIQKGDIVCIEKDIDHDILEIYEDLELFWFEEETPAGRPTGHLHRNDEQAKGHPVPRKPVPADFPTNA